MKAALISPTEFLHDIQPYSDYHLILTHKVIYDKQYCNFYAERSKAGDYILLDNSAAEKKGRSVPLKDVVLAAILTKPKVVFLPDYLLDSDRTLDELENALRSPHVRFLRRVMPDIKFAAVVQGIDANDWLECFHILNDSRNGIDVLGIPMLTTYLFGSRSIVLEQIKRKVRKSCHLLGFWKGTPLDEIYKEKQYDFVMGIDTSKPVKLALQGKPLRSWLDIERDREFIDRSHNHFNSELLKENCKGFVEACSV